MIFVFIRTWNYPSFKNHFKEVKLQCIIAENGNYNLGFKE